MKTFQSLQVCSLSGTRTFLELRPTWCLLSTSTCTASLRICSNSSWTPTGKLSQDLETTSSTLRVQSFSVSRRPTHNIPSISSYTKVPNSSPPTLSWQPSHITLLKVESISGCLHPTF